MTFPRILMKMEEEFQMKSLCKSLIALLVTSSAFLIGFYLGKEKIIHKFPNFQAEQEESPK